MNALEKSAPNSIRVAAKPVLFLLLFISVLSCKRNSVSSYVIYTPQVINAVDTVKTNPGKVLLASKCLICHSATASHDNRLAPPMVAVKMHYISSKTTQEQFANSIWEFVQEPTIAKGKMRGAIRRFGLMPQQEFKQHEIDLIADYLYNNQLDAPGWFEEHKGQNNKSKSNKGSNR